MKHNDVIYLNNIVDSLEYFGNRTKWLEAIIGHLTLVYDSVNSCSACCLVNFIWCRVFVYLQMYVNVISLYDYSRKCISRCMNILIAGHTFIICFFIYFLDYCFMLNYVSGSQHERQWNYWGFEKPYFPKLWRIGLWEQMQSTFYWNWKWPQSWRK